MSHNLTLRVTVAPASQHTRANVLSVGTSFQPARLWASGPVSSKNIVLAATLAPGLGQDQWEPQPLQYKCELQRLHLKLWTCGRTVENRSRTWA